jgi:peptidoglycan/LPS O-acetylase OafA/YrhL
VITDGKLPGIYGLRFVAALMIVIFHMSGLAGVPVPNYLWFTENQFSHGVRLFFLLSAFSLMYSTTLYWDRPDWIRVYAIKRLFRIAPLFYIMIIGNIVYDFAVKGLTPSLSVILLNVTFLFNFFAASQPSLVPTGWTLGVEMVFYAILPLVIGVVRGLGAALLFTFVSIIVSAATMGLSPGPEQPSFAILMSFPNQIQFFAAGVLTYFLFRGLESQKINDANVTALCVGIAVMAFAVMLVPNLVGSVKRELTLQYGLAVPLCGALCLWQARSPSWALANRFAVYWGERSFSIYLLHPPVLLAMKPFYGRLVERIGPALAYYVATSISVTLVLAASWVTYRFIEGPGINFGAKLYRRRRNGIQAANSQFHTAYHAASMDADSPRPRSALR